MLPQHSFGYWLRLRRKSLDLTREGLANRVGCSAETIRKIESEERRPSAQIVERLAEVFNIPPGEHKAFLSFARGDWQSAPRDAQDGSSWRLRNLPPRSNLPYPTTSLIGREKEIADIRAYLLNDDIRLVTLIGPPGIGKTHLSLEAARTVLSNFHDGIFFVALAPIDDPSLVALAILQALGYVESKNLPADQQLIYGIGEKHILLVLDNCEHLIEAVAQITSDLLSACPCLKILITSREALHIPGEWLYTVPTLGLPKENSLIELNIAAQFPALTLFAERARAIRSDFALDANNIQAVASICKQLDGLPLAIELIATRVRLLPPQVLLELLNDSYVLSADGRRTVSARQKTLNNAISWSYNILSPEEQKLFASLSVFSGGFTLEAAEAVFSRLFTKKSVSALVTSLLDKSLLQRTFGPVDEIRFNMLGTIQRFALNILFHTGAEREARKGHLAYFLNLAEQGDKKIRGPDQAEWGNRLECERDNFRMALEWAISTHQTESALRLLCALGWPWEVRGHYKEARQWLEKIRMLPDVGNYPTIYARLLNHIGRHSWTQNHSLDAHSLLEESRSISMRLRTQGELILADSLIWLGLVELFGNNEVDTARSMFAQSLELSQKWGDPIGIALGTFHLGILETEIHHDGVALSLLEKSCSQFSQLGDLFFVARVSLFLGYLFLRQGNINQARQHFEQHLKIDQQIQFWDGIGDGWRDMGYLYTHQSQYDQASRCYEKSVHVCLEHDLDKPESFYMSGLLALHHNQYLLASQRFTYLLNLARRSEYSSSVGVLLLGLASVAVGIDQVERAAQLIGAGQAFLDSTGSQWSPLEQVEFERHIQKVREQLGDSAFTALQNKGSTLTMEQAMALALEDPGLF